MGTKGDVMAVIFGHSSSLGSLILTEKTLLLARDIEGFHVAAICDAAQHTPSPRPLSAAHRMAKNVVKRLFDPARMVFIRKEMFRDLESIGRRYHVKVIVPPRRNINDPAFISYLGKGLTPNIALSFGCPQVFGMELLNVFEAVVNVHGGILPDYRGVAATEWSVYCGERTTGYTYHYMTEKIDEGPILASGEIGVDGRSVLELNYEKARLAAARLEMVLNAVFRGKNGIPQAGKSLYFGRKATRMIRTIERPSRITWKELQRRLHAFGTVRIRLDGEMVEVTRFRRLESGRMPPGALSFITADGVPVAPTRFGFLPFGLFRLMPPWVYAVV